jgi:hypothetical protein
LAFEPVDERQSTLALEGFERRAEFDHHDRRPDALVGDERVDPDAAGGLLLGPEQGVDLAGRERRLRRRRLGGREEKRRKRDSQTWRTKSIRRNPKSPRKAAPTPTSERNSRNAELN